MIVATKGDGFRLQCDEMHLMKRVTCREDDKDNSSLGAERGEAARLNAVVHPACFGSGSGTYRTTRKLGR